MKVDERGGAALTTQPTAGLDLRAARRRFVWLMPWVWLALLALHYAQRDFGLIRARVVLPVLGLAFLVSVFLKLEDVIYGRHRAAGIALFVAGALPTLVLIYLQRTPERALALVPMFVGWGVFCSLPLAPARGSRDAEPRGDAARYLALAVLALAACSSLAFMALDTGRGVIVMDESLYLLQSSLMREPGFARPIDESLRPFFAVQQAVIDRGRLYTQFPPGWPTLLALFDAVGLRWWAGIASGMAAALFTFLLGRRLYGAFAGFVAGALLATQGLFAAMAGSYMAHAAAAACVAAAAWLLVRGEATTGRSRAVQWLLAGFVLGVGVAIRPLTGGALALSLGTWMLVRGRLAPREVVTLATLLTVGSAPAFAGLLYYNRATTGSALTFGYQAVHGALHDMGFGRRGMMLTDDRGEPRPAAGEFTPRAAVVQLLGRAETLAAQTLPAFLVFPILLAGVVYRFHYRWKTVAAFLILPAVYFFYWFSDWRFYLELFPFVFVGIGAILHHVRQRDRAVGNALLLFAVASNVMAAGIFLERRRERNAPLLAYFDAVDAARREHGKVLLLARSPLSNAVPFVWLYALNAGPFPGDVVVARDLGEENARLLARFPGYVPLQVQPFGSAGGSPLKPLPMEAPAAR